MNIMHSTLEEEYSLLPFSEAWSQSRNGEYSFKYCNRFSVEEALQCGSTGFVSKVFDSKTNNVIALKVADIHLRQQIEHEYAIAKSLGDHPNIATVYEKVVDLQNNKICLTMELCDGGDLVDILSAQPDGLSTSHFLLYARQLGAGLEYMHSRGIAHRDVKSDNIVTCTETELIKWVDFGEAQHISEPIKLLRSGTLQYMAPELVTAMEITENYFNIHKFKFDLLACDVWSLGITFYSMLTSEVPFALASESDKGYCRFKDTCFSSSVKWKSISPDLQMLIVNMCEPNPNLRWDITEVNTYLEEMYINSEEQDC
eukprot:CFRG2125T1